MLDGGTAYTRSSINKVPAFFDPVYNTDSHEKIRRTFHWGSRGKDGREEVQYNPICVLTTEHIEAIIQTQNLVPHLLKVFEDELDYREYGPILEEQGL